MEWSEAVGERHDFSREELDPSWGEALGDRARPAPSDEEARVLSLTTWPGLREGTEPLDGWQGATDETIGRCLAALDGDPTAAPVTARDDLFGRMLRLGLARLYAGAPWLKRLWGDDLFFAHLMQLTEPAEWLEAMVPCPDGQGASRMQRCCDRFYLREADSMRKQLEAWWSLGPLYADHPRRRAIVRPESEPLRAAQVADDEVERVSAAIADYREKKLDFASCCAMTQAWARRGEAPPAEVAGLWIAALVDPGRLRARGAGGAGAVTAADDLDQVLSAVEERWGTFLAPMVQRVFGDDRFAAAAAGRFYAHHWFSYVAPMRLEAPDEAERAIAAWWARHGVKHRAAMARVLPVDSLLERSLSELHASAPGSSLARPALLYLRGDPATVQATLKTLVDERAPPVAAEVGYFVGRFGLDVEGLFELVVNRCDPGSSYALSEVLAQALRIRSPRVVKHLAPLARRKGLRPLVEGYLLGEGANAVDGLLDLIATKARPFALSWLEPIARDDRGKTTIAALLPGKDAVTYKHVAPLLGSLAPPPPPASPRPKGPRRTA